MGYALTFLHSQLFVSLPYPADDLSGQVIIVTGSNVGLGFEAVKHLIHLNAAKVILAVRTLSKGEAAVESIVEATKCSPTRLEVWPLDLSNFESVKQFGARVRTLDRLDAFIQNAGMLTLQWEVYEGHEAHITVNVISAALLSLEVLPKLRESAKKTGLTGRLAFVGSDAQYLATLKEMKKEGLIFDALDTKEGADMQNRYRLSKLLLFYYIRILTTLSPVGPDSNVIINNLTPGMCKTDIFRDEVGWLVRTIINVVIALLARTTEVGSRALVHGIKPDLNPTVHGAFLWDGEVAKHPWNVEGPDAAEMQERFGRELFEVLEQIEPGITSNAHP